MGNQVNQHSRLSTYNLRKLLSEHIDSRYIIINLTDDLTDDLTDFTLSGQTRMQQVIEASGAPFAYSDYIDNGELCRLIPWQEGSIRDDFDFGKIVMVQTDAMKKALATADKDYEAAGWYDMWLRLSRMIGSPVYCPEPLYIIKTGNETSVDGESAQFAYVNPRNRSYQIEMEQAATSHLKSIGAYISQDMRNTIDTSVGDFPVEASVIIPVRNRHRTIKDAVVSALEQKATFDFNVIVVDNRSNDGTSEILSELARSNPQLHVISTQDFSQQYIGIGGCWNIAVNSEYCGRFAIQLDSDDVYSSPDTLRKIVDKFRSEQCAMVIGSYTLTDFDRNVIPPGLIDHAEWTDSNGTNNALRINGLGAPRAFFTPVVRSIGFPDVCYGEDYAVGLAISRKYHIGRIYESLYLCRRWEDNTDHALDRDRINRNNYYKDYIRSIELTARKKHK